MTRLSKTPFHPFLFAVYPVVALYAVNIREVSSSVIWRPLLLLLVGTILLLLILCLTTRNWFKASLITSAYLILFFTYGRVYNGLKSTPLVDLNIIRHRYLVVVFLVFLVLISWVILKKVRELSPITAVFNIMSIVLLVLPGIQIISHAVTASSGIKTATKWAPTLNLVSTNQSSEKPDIYYIILDSIYPI